MKRNLIFSFVPLTFRVKTFRHEKYEAYEANRPELPEDLRIQMPLVYELIDSFGIPLVGCVGYRGR